ncbi:MAG: hypothetical protein J1E62_00750 [Lachnospiraceae bacterium]|nr:hypothetical protein [Lachnospiraceae bacterium]
MGNGISICAAGTGQDFVTGIRVTVSGHDKHSDKQPKTETKAIYMGGTENQDTLSQKYEFARKQALKKILSQFEQDMEIAEDMKDQGDTVMKLDSQIKDERARLEELNERKKALQEQYGVASDSQEQKDLELMQKAENHKRYPLDEQYNLSEEEEEYLANLSKTPYQEEILMLDASARELKNKISSDMRDMDVEEASIWATKKALLKVNPMKKAKDEADKIMEVARKELVGALWDQGRDKVDEEMEEEKERIDEEKLEALEEKIRLKEMEEDEAKEEASRTYMEDSVFSASKNIVLPSGQTIDNLQQDVKSLIQDQTFLDVDLKGLRVDKKL